MYVYYILQNVRAPHKYTSRILAKRPNYMYMYMFLNEKERKKQARSNKHVHVDRSL